MSWPHPRACTHAWMCLRHLLVILKFLPSLFNEAFWPGNLNLIWRSSVSELPLWSSSRHTWSMRSNDRVLPWCLTRRPEPSSGTQLSKVADQSGKGSTKPRRKYSEISRQHSKRPSEWKNANVKCRNLLPGPVPLTRHQSKQQVDSQNVPSDAYQVPVVRRIRSS